MACWASTSRSSSSARRLTAPSRSRSRRMRSRLASTSATAGSALSGLMSASCRDFRGLDLEHSRISWATSARRRLPPSKRSSARAACSRALAHGFERRARVAVGFGKRVLAFGETIGGGAASPFRRLDLADQCARFSANMRGASSSSARSRVGFLDARCQGRDLRGGAVVALAPALASPAIAASRRAAISASRASACACARTSASSRALALDCGAHGGELRFDVCGRRQRCKRALGFARARPTLRHGSRSSRAFASPSAESRAALRLASRSAST